MKFKYFLTNKLFWKNFLPLIFISFFYKPEMLFFLIFYELFLFIKISNKKLPINYITFIYLALLIIFNLIISIYINNSIYFMFNTLLFFLFISPIIFLLITNFKKLNNIIPINNYYVMKKVIEAYLFVQIIFSFINSLKWVIKFHFNFDVNFGDIIAGTFRIPFIFTPDSANVVFVFTMILVLYMYITYYGKNINKTLVFFSIFIIFLASVNHLILAVMIALLLSISYKSLFKFVLFFIFVLILYKLLQPDNFFMIIKRVILILHSFSSFENLSKLSYKGVYIVNFINDFKNHAINFLFIGMGGGTYSSRAALFFTGEYVHAFPFKNISEYMYHNTYYLWQELLHSPHWLQGAFNYPYGSIFSFIAELGLVNVFIIFVLFFYQLKRKNIFSFYDRKFIIIFLLLIGMVDNYYEYFQAFFVFYYCLLKLPSKKEIYKYE
ncbi:O-antigen polymerase [Lebetimonas sp. JS032]|uniref:O-antigen polymerase n=2 Tax=Lebetimonas TaxID=267989 RepID=UPI0004B089BA|nr:O-antigen polymerase [Lebetimonas sp. JS032]